MTNLPDSEDKFSPTERKVIIAIIIVVVLMVIVGNLYHHYQVKNAQHITYCGTIKLIFHKQKHSTRTYPLRHIVLQKNHDEKTFLVNPQMYIKQQNFKVQQTSVYVPLNIGDNLCITYSTQHPYSNESVYTREFPAVIHVELLN